MAGRLQLLAHQAAFAVQSARQHEQARALAASQERARLARDLHDAVSQALFAASLIAEAVQKQWQADTPIDPQRLEDLVQLTRGAHAELRTMLVEMQPTRLHEVDLGQLLIQLTQAMRSRKQITIDLQIDEAVSPPFDVKECLYRIAQETLNNIVKHADATHVGLTLRQQQDQIELIITDNGRGFDPAAAGSGLGLKIMGERAMAIGAQLTISSNQGKGTRVWAMWAFHPDQQSP
ncbi:MAG: sensor histidine kinase [Chloroflexi bacterium]|nr:sensor histidine kinase [Chloroflexota bacterium]